MATTTDPRHAERLTQFDYLLNAMEAAGQHENPASQGYGEKRKALYAYVRELEAAALRAQAETKRAARVVIDKASDDVRALRAELEAAADRESARVVMAHDLGQRVSALSSALREVLELAACKLDHGHWDSDEQVQDVFTRAQSALPAPPPSEAK